MSARHSFGDAVCCRYAAKSLDFSQCLHDQVKDTWYLIVIMKRYSGVEYYAFLIINWKLKSLCRQLTRIDHLLLRRRWIIKVPVKFISTLFAVHVLVCTWRNRAISSVMVRTHQWCVASLLVSTGWSVADSIIIFVQLHSRFEIAANWLTKPTTDFGFAPFGLQFIRFITLHFSLLGSPVTSIAAITSTVP